MRKLPLVFTLLFISQIAMAQTSPVVSSLPNAGAAVGVELNNGQVNFSVLFVDNFSSPNQSNGDDILTITFGSPFSGQLSCLQNLGSGQFAQPVLSQTITWPVYAAQLLHPSTGTVLVVSNATNVTLYSFSNCVATQISQVALANVGSISDFVPGSQNFLVSCNLGAGIAVETVALTNTTCQDFPSNFIVAGGFPSGYTFAGVTSASGTNATITLGSIATDGTITTTNTAPLTGQQFLGCALPSSGVVCFSSNGGTVYVQPLLAADLPNLSFATTEIFDVPEFPQAMVVGNLLGSNDGGVDVAFGGSDSVYQYTQDAGQETWTLVNTLVAPAGSDITGLAVGSLVPGENDPVVESGLITSNLTNTNDETAVVWSSLPLTEHGTSPAEITSESSVIFTQGAASSFIVTTTGTPTPTLSESGALPPGLTFNATTGVLAGTPTQAGIWDSITFTAANGVTSVAQNFTVTVNTDVVPVGLTIQNANLSEGSVTESPAPPSQVGCPSVMGNCYDVGQTVTLTATPAAGFVFGSWTGACSGSYPVCILAIVAGPTIVVNAAWAPAPVITVTPASMTIAAGGTATFQVAASNFSSTPVLAIAATIPKGSCTAAGMLITCTTTAPSSSFALPNRVPWTPIACILLALGVLAGIPRRRRIVWALSAVAFCGACGTGSKSLAVTPAGGSAPGTYSISISAASGSQKATTAATLHIE